LKNVIVHILAEGNKNTLGPSLGTSKTRLPVSRRSQRIPPAQWSFTVRNINRDVAWAGRASCHAWRVGDHDRGSSGEPKHGGANLLRRRVYVVVSCWRSTVRQRSIKSEWTWTETLPIDPARRNPMTWFSEGRRRPIPPQLLRPVRQCRLYCSWPSPEHRCPGQSVALCKVPRLPGEILPIRWPGRKLEVGRSRRAAKI